MGESRARRRIREAVESRGFTLESLEYERPYDVGEKMGWGGGWWGETAEQVWPNTFPGNEFGGLNVEDCLADIDWALKPPTGFEGCDCVRPANFHPRGGLKGWPSQVGMHDPGCRWHIEYRLTWWTQHGPDWSHWKDLGDWAASNSQKPWCLCGYEGTPEECAAIRGEQ